MDSNSTHFSTVEDVQHHNISSLHPQYRSCKSWFVFKVRLAITHCTVATPRGHFLPIRTSLSVSAVVHNLIFNNPLNWWSGPSIDQIRRHGTDASAHPVPPSPLQGSANTTGMTPVSQAVLLSHWSSGAEEPG